MEAWPHERMNLSRSGQSGDDGWCAITRENSVTPSGANAIAVPGWPDLAAAGASIASPTIALMARPSSSVAPGYKASAMVTSVASQPFEIGLGGASLNP